MLHDTRRVATVKIQTTKLNLIKESSFVVLFHSFPPPTSIKAKGQVKKDMKDGIILYPTYTQYRNRKRSKRQANPQALGEG